MLTTFYPFSVLATNRMLNTFIQRKPIETASLVKRVKNFLVMRRFRSDMSDIMNLSHKVKVRLDK